MKSYLDQLLNLMPDNLAGTLRNRFAPGPIATGQDVAEFVQTRAAHVAQTSLFGYLKQRMGISYPRYFQDEVFAESIRVSQGKVYRACAADLAVFAAAVAGQEGELKSPEITGLAIDCFRYAMNNSGAELGEAVPDWNVQFRDRAERTVWPQAAIAENAFTESPGGLIDAAPVVNEFKRLDSEIVENSIRFRWRDVREQFRKRVDADSIREDLRAGAATSSDSNGNEA